MINFFTARFHQGFCLLSVTQFLPYEILFGKFGILSTDNPPNYIFFHSRHFSS